MKHFLAITDDDLISFLKSVGEKPYRSRQIYRWIYKMAPLGANFETMTDLSSGLRQKLSESFYIYSLKVVSTIKSSDGTVRYNFKSDGTRCRRNVAFSSVFIPSSSGKRNTICLSTQSGCPVGCIFCASGGTFARNLTKGEIIESYLLTRRLALQSGENFLSVAAGNNSTENDAGKRFGVLFMGSGEPFLNYENVISENGAIDDLLSDSKVGLGSRNVVLSTVGITSSVGAIKKFADTTARRGLKIRLALSLHTADDKLRRCLIPFKNLSPVDALLDDGFYYASLTGTRLTLECVMIKGITDAPDKIQLLCATIKKHINKHNWKDVSVNLIPFNNNKRGKAQGFLPPDGKSLAAVKNFLVSRGIFTIIRANRGQDISSACGQLDAGGIF